MIKSNKEVVISDLNQIKAQIYIEASGRDEKEQGKVSFINNFYYLREFTNVEPVKVKTGTIVENLVRIDENGDEVPTGETNTVDQFEMVDKTVIRPKLVLYHSRKATYKAEVFYAKYPDITPDQIDQAILNEMDWLEARDWTGKELERISVYGLKSSDCTKLSAEDVAELLKPRIVE